MDWVLTAFLLIGVVLGLKHGMSQELPRLLEILIALYVAFEYHPVLTDWLTRETPCPEAYARPLTFGLVSFLAWLSLRLLFEILGKLIHLEVANPFQILGGLLIGGARYFLIFALISYLFILFPLDWIHRAYQVQSWSGPFLTELPPKIYAWTKSTVVSKIRP